MRKFFLCLMALICFSCTTTQSLAPDIVRSEIDEMPELTEAAEEGVSLPEVKIEYRTQYVERLFYVPEGEEVMEEKRELIDGAITPEHWRGGVFRPQYDPDFQFFILCKTGKNTDILLQEEEYLVNDIIMSDSANWRIIDGRSQAKGVSRNHIYVKPTLPDLENDLIINTNLRTYYLRLSNKKYNNPLWKNAWMMKIEFDYPLALTSTSKTIDNTIHEKVQVDEKVNWNYEVQYKGDPPLWLPEMVWDDGFKTHILLPEKVKVTQFPGVWGPQGEILNTRIKGREIELDLLMEEFLMKLDKVKVKIVRREEI